MVSRKILFHLLEAILQTGSCKQKLARLSVSETKSATLFLNIFINDFFLFPNIYEICDYADDNTLYPANIDINLVISYLSKDLGSVTKSFYYN